MGLVSAQFIHPFSEGDWSSCKEEGEEEEAVGARG